MRCMECGGVLIETVENVTTTFKGESFRVEGVPHYKCESCGSVEYDADAMEKMTAEVNELYRKRKGLLSPSEVKQVRKMLGLTQEEFQALLGVGKTTVSRWERGRIVQGKPEDNLMRLLRSHPELASELSERKEAAIREGDAGATSVGGTIVATIPWRGNASIRMRETVIKSKMEG